MKRYSKWLLRLVGPALLVYFLATTDLTKIAETLSSITLWPLLLSLALYPAFIAVKALRWNLLMRELNLQPPSLGRSMVLYMIGLFLGSATPGQSGDFVKGWYLHAQGQPLAPILLSILLDRLFDVMTMALLALLGLIAFINVFPPSARVPAIAITVVFIGGTLLLMARRPRDWFIARLLPIAPQRIRGTIERWQTQFSSLSLRPALFAQLLGVSALSATATMLRIYLLYVAMGLSNIPLLVIFSTTALIAILQALPISISGLGVREAVLIPVLLLYGYTREQALGLSALFLLINIEHLLIGFLVSLRFPLGKVPQDINQELQSAENMENTPVRDAETV